MAPSVGNPGGYDERVLIPGGSTDLVLEAAEECPGECTFMAE